MEMDILKHLLIPLLSAHLMGDFLLQPDFLAKANRDGILYSFLHASIVAGLSYLLCGTWTLWQIPAVILATHSTLDRLKSHREDWRFFILGQVGHILVIVALSMTLAIHPLPPSLWLSFLGPVYGKFLVLLSAFVAAVPGGGVLVQMVVNPLLKQIEEVTQEGGKQTRGLHKAGKLIGQLERTLILVFVLTGEISAIGFLVAAKSIFRFGELKDRENRMEAEYIIIGTLLSFTVAIVVGYLARLALKSLG